MILCLLKTQNLLQTVSISDEHLTKWQFLKHEHTWNQGVRGGISKTNYAHEDGYDIKQKLKKKLCEVGVISHANCVK